MVEFKSADGYKPTESEEFMNDKMVAYFRAKLMYIKDELSSRNNTETLKEDLQSMKEPDILDRATMEEGASLDLINHLLYFFYRAVNLWYTFLFLNLGED